MLKNFCAEHRRPTPNQGLTTRLWGVELPLQATAIPASPANSTGRKETK